MPKVGMEPIRRRQLIAATIASIHEEGLANTTLSQISRRAGLSTGIVSHYFQDKAGLLEATMRSLAESLRRRVIAEQAAAQSPEERVFAVRMFPFGVHGAAGGIAAVLVGDPVVVLVAAPLVVHILVGAGELGVVDGAFFPARVPRDAPDPQHVALPGAKRTASAETVAPMSAESLSRTTEPRSGSLPA